MTMTDCQSVPVCLAKKQKILHKMDNYTCQGASTSGRFGRASSHVFRIGNFGAVVYVIQSAINGINFNVLLCTKLNFAQHCCDSLSVSCWEGRSQK